MTFDGYARQMGTVFTSALRTVCTARLVSVAQQTYAEHIDSLDTMTYAIKVSTEPLPGLALLDLPLPVVMTTIDQMLGGPGSDNQPRRPLTDIESAVVRGVVTRLLGELAYSVASVVELTPAVVGIEYNAQLAQAAAPGDAMIVASFDLTIKERTHSVSFCMPFAGLHPVLAKAAAPSPVSEREREQRTRAAELVDLRFRDVPVDAVVRFRPTRLGPDALTHLAVGDVLRLSHRATDPLDVVVGEATFAHATAGSHGARLAALVVGTASNKENS